LRKSSTSLTIKRPSSPIKSTYTSPSSPELIKASIWIGEESFEYGPGLVIRIFAICGGGVALAWRKERIVAVGDASGSVVGVGVGTTTDRLGTTSSTGGTARFTGVSCKDASVEVGTGSEGKFIGVSVTEIRSTGLVLGKPGAASARHPTLINKTASIKAASLISRLNPVEIIQRLYTG